ncbi:MAG: isopenicillin N synthase family dioxygenase [Alphaproteobacteria bacterium]
MSVPTIDIGPYFDGDLAARRAVARQIGEACESIGFFSIVGAPVDQVLIDQAFATAAAFYDQSQAVKDRCRPENSAAARGYHKLGTKNLAKTLGYNNPPDLREQFYLGPLDDRSGQCERFPDAAFLYAQNIWPETPVNYQPVFTEYYRTLERLSGNLMRLFALALDQPEPYFDDKIDEHFSTLPANDYPALDYEPLPDQVRCGEHSDFGSLTILAVGDGESGLQVRTRQGDWIDATTDQGQFIVNIGDMMQRWTNDRWISNVHRVANVSSSDGPPTRRQSIGFFMHPNYDAEIACLPSCADAENPSQYPVVLAGKLMQQKLEARAE